MVFPFYKDMENIYRPQLLVAIPSLDYDDPSKIDSYYLNIDEINGEDGVFSFDNIKILENPANKRTILWKVL